MIQSQTNVPAVSCYIDTSAYMEFLTDGARASDVIAAIGGCRWRSSSLLVLETYRSLVRMSRERRIDAEQFHACLDRLELDAADFELRDATFDLCSGTVMPVASTPRSLDLVHLRTALWFHQREPLAKFVTLDDQQRAGARELGLPT